jgi:GxxExxY protein
MATDEGLHRELTAKIVDAAIEVHRILGPGYVELVYETAFAHELDLRGIKYERQKTIQIPYKGIQAGEHRLDLLIEGVVVVELKAIKELTDVDLARMLSYLKATNREVGLFLNFAKPRMKDGIRRVARSQPANLREFLCVLCVSAVHFFFALRSAA